LKLFGWLAGGISVAALSLAPVLLRAQAKVTPVPDAQVESSVLKALAANSQLAGQPIQTSTVTLSGNVRDEPSRKAAESIVSQTPGVLKVIDELTLNSDAAGTQSREGDGNSQNPYTPSNRDASNAPLQSDATLASAPLEPAPPSAPVPSQRSPLPSQSQEDQARSQQGGETRKSAPIERPYSQPPYAQSPTVPPPYPPSPNRPVPRPAYPNPAPSATQPYVTQPYAAQSYAAQSYAAQPEGQSVTVPAGSLVRVRVNQELDSEHTPAGTVFDAVVLNDVIADGFVAVPRGATIQGVVAIAKKSGALKGRGELAVQLTQVILAGRSYPLSTDLWSNHGGNKTARTVNSALGLGAVGAVIGGIAGGGAGAAIGAGAGGAAGVGTSAISPDGQAYIPSEAILTFHLTRQTALATVSQAEMDRLGYGVPGRPGAPPRPPLRSLRTAHLLPSLPLLNSFPTSLRPRS